MTWSEALTQLQLALGAPAEFAWVAEAIAYLIGATVLATLSLTLALVLIWITRKGRGDPGPARVHSPRCWTRWKRITTT